MRSSFVHTMSKLLDGKSTHTVMCYTYLLNFAFLYYFGCIIVIIVLFIHFFCQESDGQGCPYCRAEIKGTEHVVVDPFDPKRVKYKSVPIMPIVVQHSDDEEDDEDDEVVK